MKNVAMLTIPLGHIIRVTADTATGQAHDLLLVCLLTSGEGVRLFE